MTDFVHLHVHTQYSLLDGLSKIDELLLKAKALKMKAMAITDHGVMYGAVKFHNAAKKLGIKPIIGMEGYLTTRDCHEKSPGAQKQTYHLVMLAKNFIGYQNLMRLTTYANLEGYYYKPRFDFPALEKYSEGLIVTTACVKGLIPQMILENNEKKALEYCRYFQKLFKDDFYLELQVHQGLPELKKINHKLVEFSHQLGIPLVATNDLHYVNQDDAKAQDALLAIQTKTVLSDKNRLSMINSPDYYLKSGEEMAQLFLEHPEAIANTVKIAAKCNLTIPTGKWILPSFVLPKGFTKSEKYLQALAQEGLIYRFSKITPQIQKRLDYELKIICDKGFATYFLIVQDFVNWAKQHHIRVGPGRGSVAGSLVAFALRITTIDPLEHNIPFERFMNAERPSPPDIDLDFADDRRDEVINYVADKYGKDKVAQIITFGTMEARGAIRDIGRVLGMPYSESDKISKLIPLGFSLEEAMVNVPELQTYYHQPEFKELINLAKKVEGTARHASTHAAGVVIGDKPLTDYTPLQIETKNNRVMTQYDMYSLDCNIDQDAIGLLKIDLLGLRNLTILQNSINFVQEQRHLKVDMSELPLDDPQVYLQLSKGNNIGVFQLESGGMRSVAKKLRPSRFSDITAMVALYRPGPMGLIDDFIAGKKNPASIKYPHPDLKPVLEETYGIAVYQEQALQIANVMAGYSLAEADLLRRAIGKKKHALMAKEKFKFIQQSRAKGYTKVIAERVWGYIEKFVGYGFNKAHATAYAMIAYQTAYMKVHYPVEFMAALLTAETSNKDKVPLAVAEAKRMEIKVFPPDINLSCTNFTIVKDKTSLNQQAIMFGLSAIKNVGEAAIEAIIQARKTKKFSSLTDFCQRVDNQKANKKVLESLIQVGCFDAFAKRSQLLLSLEKIRQNAAETQKNTNSPQVSLFSAEENKKNETVDKLTETEEFSKLDLLNFEKQLLGFYLTEHPLAQSMDKIKQLTTHQIAELDPQVQGNQTVTIGGIIKGLKIIITKKSNQEMAFANLDDNTAAIELVIFPKLFRATKLLWANDQPVLVTGKLDFKDRLSLIVNSAVNPTAKLQAKPTAPKAKPRSVTLEIKQTTPKEILVRLNQLFQANQGEDTLTLNLVNGEQPKEITLPYSIDFSAIKTAVEKILTPHGGIILYAEN